MNARIIDLSVPLENDVKADPPGSGPSIKYYAHGDQVAILQRYFPGLAREDLPDGEGWAIEADQSVDPQRHPPRRAVALRLDHGPRQACR